MLMRQLKVNTMTTNTSINILDVLSNDYLVHVLQTKHFQHHITLGQPMSKTVCLRASEEGFELISEEHKVYVPVQYKERMEAFNCTPRVGDMLGIGSCEDFNVFVYDGHDFQLWELGFKGK